MANGPLRPGFHLDHSIMQETVAKATGFHHQTRDRTTHCDCVHFWDHWWNEALLQQESRQDLKICLRCNLKKGRFINPSVVIEQSNTSISWVMWCKTKMNITWRTKKLLNKNTSNLQATSTTPLAWSKAITPETFAMFKRPCFWWYSKRPWPKSDAAFPVWSKVSGPLEPRRRICCWMSNTDCSYKDEMKQRVACSCTVLYIYIYIHTRYLRYWVFWPIKFCKSTVYSIYVFYAWMCLLCKCNKV